MVMTDDYWVLIAFYEASKWVLYDVDCTLFYITIWWPSVQIYIDINTFLSIYPKYFWLRSRAHIKL